MTGERAVALMLLVAAQDLAEIWGWPPSASLVADAVSFAEGRGGISERDAHRLSVWARRWCSLHPDLRAFLGRHSDHPAASSVLWSVLGHYPAPEGATMGRLYAMWEEEHGYRPPFSLCPRTI